VPKRPTYSRPDVERAGSAREENKAVEARRAGAKPAAARGSPFKRSELAWAAA